MGFHARMKKAKNKMKELAHTFFNLFGKRELSEEEWLEIKKQVHKHASSLKHFVYNETFENRDKANNFSFGGHEERMLIYSELKNTFYSEWKKLRSK